MFLGLRQQHLYPDQSLSEAEPRAVGRLLQHSSCNSDPYQFTFRPLQHNQRKQTRLRDREDGQFAVLVAQHGLPVGLHGAVFREVF